MKIRINSSLPAPPPPVSIRISAKAQRALPARPTERPRAAAAQRRAAPTAQPARLLPRFSSVQPRVGARPRGLRTRAKGGRGGERCAPPCAAAFCTPLPEAGGERSGGAPRTAAGPPGSREGGSRWAGSPRRGARRFPQGQAAPTLPCDSRGGTLLPRRAWLRLQRLQPCVSPPACDTITREAVGGIRAYRGEK